MSRLRAVACIAVALTAAPAAFAQQNDYGGYDIVGQPRSEVRYGDTRGWAVFSAKAGSTFAYCFAQADRGDGSSFRLGWDGMQWQLAVPVTSRPDWSGTLQIDGAGSGQGYKRGGEDISGTATGDWTIAWLGEAELDGIRKGSTAVLGVGRGDFDFSLAGATAATLKVKECVARAGKAAQPAAAAQPEPSQAAAVRFGKAGSWIVSEVRDGRRTVACEAYDPETNPNLHIEIDRENAYIDFRDGGPMRPLGERISVRVGFGPGSEPTDMQADMIERLGGEAWARITERRDDGPGLLDDAIPNSQQISFSSRNINLETRLAGSNRALDLLFRCSDKIR